VDFFLFPRLKSIMKGPRFAEFGLQPDHSQASLNKNKGSNSMT
jgi:hypothetical protein